MRKLRLTDFKTTISMNTRWRYVDWMEFKRVAGDVLYREFLQWMMLTAGRRARTTTKGIDWSLVEEWVEAPEELAH